MQQDDTIQTNETPPEFKPLWGLGFHEKFSGLLQLIVLIALVVSKLSLLYFPNNKAIEEIYHHSFILIVFPLMILVIVNLDSLFTGDFWNFLLLPFRVANDLIIELLDFPSHFTPKNITKRIFCKRHQTKLGFTIGGGVILLISLIFIFEMIECNPTTEKINTISKVILFLWVGLCAVSGNVFFAFSSSALLIINWLTPIFSFETEEEKQNDKAEE